MKMSSKQPYESRYAAGAKKIQSKGTGGSRLHSDPPVRKSKVEAVIEPLKKGRSNSAKVVKDYHEEEGVFYCKQI